MINTILQRSAAGLLGVFLWAGAVRAAEAAAPASKPDVLIYADGDRVRGKLIERTGDTLVFASEKFGELRVAAALARVETGSAPTATPAGGPDAEAARAPEQPAEPEGRARLSPYALTQAVRGFFGPWHGRFSFSTEIASDTTDRNTTTLEAKLQRKWTRDEVEAVARYDFTQSGEVTTRDVARVTGSWRRDFQPRYFALYRPTFERNRASKRPDGVVAEYFLSQQEIGGGVNFFTAPHRRLRAGVAQNFFDVWVTAPETDRTSATSASVFGEVEWKLPWRINLVERGVWYPPLNIERSGWENRIELNKKLTETLSVALRHETRQNNPDARVRDYTLLRVLLGLDF